MKSLKLKKYLPRSFFGRALLIIILPIILLELAIGFAFIQRYFEQVTTQLTKSIVLEVNYVVDEFSKQTAAKQESFLSSMEDKFQFELSILNEHKQKTFSEKYIYDFSGITLIKVLKSDVKNISYVNLKQRGMVRVITKMGKNEYIKFEIPRERLTASNPHQLLVLMVLLTIILGFVLLMILRNQIKPIKSLAFAAEAFGKGQSISYKPTGSIEIRKAGAAFLEMRKRIERQIEQRTQMLSGVSHDLRTPLTRLKLALALQENDPENEAMLKDIQMMQNILEEFLEFTKNQSTEKFESLLLKDFCTLLKELRLDGEEKIIWKETFKNKTKMLRLRPNNFTRAIKNLVENANSYGSKILITINEKNNKIFINIEDNGPGIPRGQIQEALKPFVRLDNSRNLNRPQGVGLGLSIASDTIKSHGGTLNLQKSKSLGGLKASISIPI